MPSIYRQTTPKTRLPRPSQRLPARLPAEKKQGFAVLIALSLMSFVLVIVLSLILMASVEIANAANAKDRLLARENARLGLMIALGDLQKHAGPDQRVTARGEIEPGTLDGAKMWTGLWNTESGTPTAPVWLVSGDNPDPVTGASGGDSATLYPETTNQAAVRAEWVPISGSGASQQGKFAFWVEEQSVKARMNRADRTQKMTYLSGSDEAQDVRERLLLFPSQDFVFDTLISVDDPEDTPLTPEQVESFGRALTGAQLGLTFPSDEDSAPALLDRRHDFTAYASAVLENPLKGGLKTNLTGRNQEEIDDLLALPGNNKDHYLKGDFLLHYNIDPTTGAPFPQNATANAADSSGGSLTSTGDLVRVPASDFFDLRANANDPEDGETQVVRNIMPIITEASFRLGAFHNQVPTFNWHRIRFHADVEFWNPYPFPIRFPGEGQNRAFVVMLLPSQMGGLGRSGSEPERMILSIQKLGGGLGREGGGVQEELHTNLFNFDEQLFQDRAAGNTINETVMTSWMEIENVVLQPGEVYHATTGQTSGLARDLGGYVLPPGGDPENPADYIVDSSHTLNRWSWDENPNENEYPVLTPSDTIRISLRMPPSGLTFRLIPFDSRSQNSTPVYEEDTSNEWAKPIFELRNLYAFDNPSPLILRGDEYSRASSGSYTEDNYNIGFHFRLDDELIFIDENALNLGIGFDLRQPVWDYENPAVKKAIVVGGLAPEIIAAGTQPDPFDTVFQKDNFYNEEDVFADSNLDTHSGNYERVFLYPKQVGDPLSVGSFQNLPLSYETVEYDADGDGTDDFVQLKAGMPWGGSLNEAFDKYFFTGVPSLGWTNNLPLPVPAEVRSGTTGGDLRLAEAAGDFLIEGSFNVNSRSPRAWAAMLGRTLHDWEHGGPDAIDLKNGFLNLSHSTDSAIEVLGGLSEESALTTPDSEDLSGEKTASRLAMRHPLRRLTDTSIYNPDTAEDDSLVEFVIEELDTYFEANPPFASVSEFIDSGILARAIRRSEINGSIAKFSPAYISQANLLEPIAPFLTVRSDTFVIRSVGQQVDAITGNVTSQILCEAVVQRLPDRVDVDDSRLMENATSNNNTFGRRFVIREITWRGDDS